MANLTRTRQAVLIEPLRPERFTVNRTNLEVSFKRENNAPNLLQVRTFNATSLYILSICEVCGSYQCPYCPFYSSAPPTPSPHPLLTSAILAALTVIASGSFHMK